MFEAPTCQLFDCLPVRCLVPFTNEANDHDVICIFNDGIGGEGGGAVMCIQSEGTQKRAQHTALGRACSEGQGGVAGSAHFNYLWEIC